MRAEPVIAWLQNEGYLGAAVCDCSDKCPSIHVPTDAGTIFEDAGRIQALLFMMGLHKVTAITTYIDVEEDLAVITIIDWHGKLKELIAGDPWDVTLN